MLASLTSPGTSLRPSATTTSSPSVAAHLAPAVPFPDGMPRRPAAPLLAVVRKPVCSSGLPLWIPFHPLPMCRMSTSFPSRDHLAPPQIGPRVGRGEGESPLPKPVLRTTVLLPCQCHTTVGRTGVGARDLILCPPHTTVDLAEGGARGACSTMWTPCGSPRPGGHTRLQQSAAQALLGRGNSA